MLTTDMIKKCSFSRTNWTAELLYFYFLSLTSRTHTHTNYKVWRLFQVHQTNRLFYVKNTVHPHQKTAFLFSCGTFGVPHEYRTCVIAGKYLVRKAFGLSSVRMETWQQYGWEPLKKLTDIYSLNAITDDKSFKNTGSDICEAGRYGWGHKNGLYMEQSCSVSFSQKRLSSDRLRFPKKTAWTADIHLFNDSMT